MAYSFSCLLWYLNVQFLPQSNQSSMFHKLFAKVVDSEMFFGKHNLVADVLQRSRHVYEVCNAIIFRIQSVVILYTFLIIIYHCISINT